MMAGTSLSFKIMSSAPSIMQVTTGSYGYLFSKLHQWIRLAFHVMSSKIFLSIIVTGYQILVGEAGACSVVIRSGRGVEVTMDWGQNRVNSSMKQTAETNPNES